MSVLRITDKDIKNYFQIGFTASDKQRIFLKKIIQANKTYSYKMMPIQRKELRELIESCGIKYSKVIKSRPKDYKWINQRELEKAFNIMMNQSITDRQIKQKIDFIAKLLNDEIRFEKIREISIKDNDDLPLYDFSVPLMENYISNGFIVHNSTYRIYLRKGKKDSRVAKLIDSPDLPDNETVFFVTDKGIIDE